MHAPSSFLLLGAALYASASSPDNTLDQLSTRSIRANTISWLCQKPLVAGVCSGLGQLLTPKPGKTISVVTPKGPVTGAVFDKANRFTLRYAHGPRFAAPEIVGSWRKTLDATQLPPPCPQADGSGNAEVNEDCLFINVYTPRSANGASRLPVMVWVHGGSLLYGSSTNPGLDGSNFASANNVIVVTLQYRLGAFGFLAAQSAGVPGNMGLQDVLAAFAFTKSVIGSFGGDANKITAAGQSSGADLIRTMLAAPAADSLFRAAIIQSAPVNYADYNATVGNQVGALFLENAGCSDLACLRHASVADLLEAQLNTAAVAPTLSPAVAASVPLRPIIDGHVVRADSSKLIDGQDGGLTNKKRALLLTTVRDEAGPTIQALDNQAFGGGPIPIQFFAPVVQQVVTDARAEAILDSGLYDPAPDASDARDALDVLGTEYIWRCAVQQFALNATANHQSPNVYLGEFDLGITYDDNKALDFCGGRVCHEDDIYAVFGTGSSLSSAQRKLQTEVVARWGAFVKNGSPNAPSYANWPTVGTGTPHLLVFGANGVGRAAIGQGLGCDPRTLWGGVAPFDAQLY